MDETITGQPHASIFNSDTARAIDALTKEVKAGVEWLKSHSDLATKQDLAETEKRILDAVSAGAHDDPKLVQALAEATAKLKTHTDSLKAGVDAAKSVP